MSFDIDAATAAGHSTDDQVAYLAKLHNYDVDAATAAGHSKQEVLQYLANLPEPTAAPASAPAQDSSIPLAPAGAVIGAATGAAAGPAVGKAIDTGVNTVAKVINPAAAPQQDALTRALSGAPESNSPQAVRNWLKTQTSNPFAGGKDMGAAYRKSQLAAGEPVQSRGSSIPIRKGNLGITNQLPEATPSERVASSILNAERVGTPHMLRRVAGMGVAGAELGNAVEEAAKGNYGRAALSGLGVLGGAASQSRIKPIRAIGTGIAAAVPAIQYMLPEEVEHKADGGSIAKKALKHVPGAALMGALTLPEIAEAAHQIRHGQIGEGVGSLIGTAANFLPGALGAAYMALSPSELGDDSLYERPSVYEEGQTDILKGSYLPPGHASGGAIEEGINLAKKLFTPRETKILRASEALAPHEGKWLNLTQSDRMRSTGGDLGGPGFSKFQLENPDYAGAAWGVGKKGTATGITNVNQRYPEGQAIWTPMIGSETQHHSNQHVYDALKDEFNRQVSAGKLTPELQEKIKTRLATRPELQGLFPEDFNIANPEHLEQYGNTFDRRGALSTLMSGNGIGGAKGRIIDYPGIMQEMTDPMVVGSPTHALGTRLFNLTGEVEHRPDLHSAFPYILKGEDQGVAFNPVPKELGIPDFINQFKEFKGRDPGYYDLTRTVPSQQITDKYLKSLDEAGHKKGGKIKKKK